MRKHFLEFEQHRSGAAIRIAAEEHRYAAMTPDTEVLAIDGLSVVVTGRAEPEAVMACVERAKMLRAGPPMRVVTKGWWTMHEEEVSVAELQERNRAD